MTSPAAARSTPLLRFLRTPKGLLIVLLTVLLALAGWGAGWRLVAPGIAAAVLTAVVIDLPILRMRKGRWLVPDGAVLTGMIIAMVLSPHEAWYLAAATATIAVVSKHLLRSGSANVFNPAALALVATFYLFDTGQSWWGALPELPSAAIALLLATGIYITIQVNKVPLVLAFLGVYYLLITITAFVSDPGHVAELYRAPDLHAALFFVFFMLTDPPTSPAKHRDQWGYGVIVAVVSYAVFELVGAACYLLIGLLVTNAWEAWRRARAKATRATRGLATS